MKFICMLGTVLILVILFLTCGQCHAQQYSPAFNSLLNQIQQAYLAPKGEKLLSLSNKYPAVLAGLIGHALRQQMIHVQQNRSLNNPFMSLQREAQAYITQVAQTTPARLQDGSRFTPEGLWYLVNNAFQGQDDGWILQNFGVRTGTMPSVLAASTAPPPSDLPPSGRPPFKKEEPPSGDGIELVGVKPQRGVPADPPEPTKGKSIINKDTVIGLWEHFNPHPEQKQVYDKYGGVPFCRLKIEKQADYYVGRVTILNRAGFQKYFGCNDDGVMFKVQYSGTFRGTESLYRWQGKGWKYDINTSKCGWTYADISVETDPKRLIHTGLKAGDWLWVDGCNWPSSLEEFRRIGR
jgi:hypothetical protein